MNMKALIAIAPHKLDGDSRPTYFVDLVTDNGSGGHSWSNLRCTDDVHEARKIARGYAVTLGNLSVSDPTLYAKKLA
jgi:hypothetical protein